MGSRCSILNDTKHDVWITHGINWKVLTGVITGLLNVLALVANVLARGPVGAGGALSKAAKTTIVGLTRKEWAQVADVLNMSSSALAELLRLPKEGAEKVKSSIQEFQNKAERIAPGEKYTWSGTLSLTKQVYVMNDKLQCDDRGCFTGPTADSENVYPISMYFKKLDVN